MKSKLLAERGQALILIALAAIGLVAITGLAIDGSAKYSDRRHAQNAADAAALAAALTKVDGLTAGKTNDTCSTASGFSNSAFCLDIINTAWDRAADNGYQGLIPNSVDVYSPPISGAYTGNTAYVQVIITSYVNTFFTRVLGINQTKNTVQAVSLAGKGGVLGDGAMLISYDPDPNCSTGGTGGYSVQVSGNSTIDLHGGGIFLNSHDVCGFKIPNCADLNIYGGSGINSVGADNINTDGCTFDPPLPENFNQDPVTIPDDIEYPNVPPECGMSPAAPTYLGVDGVDGRGEWLIYPGYYETFPHGALVVNKQHIYMASGVYCIDPGGTGHNWDLSWSSVDAASLNGSTDPAKNKWAAYNPNGVTLYIKSGGGFQFNNNSPTKLDASTTGDYQGYLIVLEGSESSIESCSIEGGSDIDLNGMIFAPYCNITVNGDSVTNAKINAQLLGWDLKINGGAGINFTYDPKYKVTIKRRVGLMQ